MNPSLNNSYSYPVVWVLTMTNALPPAHDAQPYRLLSLLFYQPHPCYPESTPAHEGRLSYIQDTPNILNVLVPILS